jgi:hypothetical protein
VQPLHDDDRDDAAGEQHYRIGQSPIPLHGCVRAITIPVPRDRWILREWRDVPTECLTGDRVNGTCLTEIQPLKQLTLHHNAEHHDGR